MPLSSREMYPANGAMKWPIRSITALAGVDLVVASILPGGFVEMASDVHAPEATDLTCRWATRQARRTSSGAEDHPHVPGHAEAVRE